MPKGAEKMSRNMNLDVKNSFPGCMGGMINMFDWNNAVLGGKKLLTDPDFADGIEAPRNSLETLFGGFGIADSRKSSSATKSDILFGLKIPKSVTTPTEYSSDNEKRRRSPSVVARLMGLDALPNAETATVSDQQQSQLLKNQKERISVVQNLLKDSRGRHAKEHVRTPDSKEGKEHTISENRRPSSVYQVNENDQFESAPFREEHPQEKQLQEFKKQFASKFSIPNNENRQTRQSESVEREVEVKEVMAQEKMDEAKDALSSDVKNDPRSDAKNDPGRLAAALEKLNKSKEFQDVLEVLQSNKEFFLKFLQDPNALLLDKNVLVAARDQTNFGPPPPVEVKAKEEESVPKPEKRKGGISPTAFARRFMASRREGKQSKEKLKSQDSKSQHESKSRSESEESTPRSSTSLLPRLRRRSKSKPAEIDAGLGASPAKEQGRSKPKGAEIDTGLTVRPAMEQTEISCASDSHNKVDPSSTVSVVLSRPGSTDSSTINSPASISIQSPRISRAGKESTSKGYKMMEETREYQHYPRDRTPNFPKHRHDDRNYAPSSDDISRHAKESFRHRDTKDKNERERSKESREIARDIIREARASMRAFDKFEPSSAGELTFSQSSRAGRRSSLLRIAPDSADTIGSCSERDVTPYSISGRREDHTRPRSGLSNLSSAVAAHLAARSFQDGENREVDLRKRRGVNKQLALLLEPQNTPADLRKYALHTSDNHRPGSPRLRSVSSSSKALRKAIAGSLLESRALASDSSPYYNISLPQVHVRESMASTSQSEEESVANSPTLSASSPLQRCRSVPNAALVRDGRSRAAEQNQNSTGGWAGGSPSPRAYHEPSSAPESSPSVPGGKQFSDSYKRGVEAVGSLFARAKSRERNKIFVRSRKKSPIITDCSCSSGHEPKPVSRSSSVTALEDSACGQLVVIRDPSPTEPSAVLLAATSESKTGATEKSTVTENSSGSDVASSSLEPRSLNSARQVVDQQHSPDLLPSLTTPKGQRDQYSPTDSMVTDILEVSAGDDLARTPPKISSIALQPPRSEGEDAQETGGDVEKGGQPSPISVLDSPFEEDSPSPLEFNEVSSDLQELRLRLRLLKLDRSDQRERSAQELSDIETRVAHQALLARESHNSKETTDCHVSTNSETSTPGVAVYAPFAQEDCDNEQAWLESFDLEGFPYPEGCREDLVYVRNLLVASEFVESVTKVFTRWYSAAQPLHPILFENLEEYYNRGIYEPQFRIKNGHIKSTGVADARPTHFLLFNAVNEILLKKLGPYLTVWPWVHPSTHLRRPVPVGKLLVWETWMELCGYFPSSNGDLDAANFLLDRDLGRRQEWTGENVEELGLKLENAIFDDLIEDTIRSFVELKHD